MEFPLDRSRRIADRTFSQVADATLPPYLHKPLLLLTAIQRFTQTMRSKNHSQGNGLPAGPFDGEGPGLSLPETVKSTDPRLVALIRILARKAAHDYLASLEQDGSSRLS